MTASLGQRRSHARHGAAAINATIAEVTAQLEAAQDAEYAAARARAAEAKAAEKARPKLTRDDLAGATHVRDRFGWHKVARVNKTTVSVETGYSWVDRIPFDKVLEVRR